MDKLYAACIIDLATVLSESTISNLLTVDKYITKNICSYVRRNNKKYALCIHNILYLRKYATMEQYEPIGYKIIKNGLINQYSGIHSRWFYTDMRDVNKYIRDVNKCIIQNIIDVNKCIKAGSQKNVKWLIDNKALTHINIFEILNIDCDYDMVKFIIRNRLVPFKSIMTFEHLDILELGLASYSIDEISVSGIWYNAIYYPKIRQMLQKYKIRLTSDVLDNTLSCRQKLYWSYQNHDMKSKVVWLIENNCPFSAYSFGLAAANYDIEILELMQKNNCPISKNTFATAVKYRNVEVMEWLLNNFYNVKDDKELLEQVIKAGLKGRVFGSTRRFLKRNKIIDDDRKLII